MSSLEDDEKREGIKELFSLKEEKELKVLTPNKLLTRLPILLAEIKAGNNSYKLNNEIRQMLHLLYLFIYTLFYIDIHIKKHKT